MANFAGGWCGLPPPGEEASPADALLSLRMRALALARKLKAVYSLQGTVGRAELAEALA